MKCIVGYLTLFLLMSSVFGQSKALKSKADKGNVEAMVEIARIYKEKGGKGNLNIAAKYFKRAAEKGNAEAQFQMGMFCKNQWVTVDSCFLQAVRWWEKAARQGHTEALYQMGRVYWKKVSFAVAGYKKDDVKALDYFNQAAAKGHVQAAEDAKKICIVDPRVENWIGGLSVFFLILLGVILFFKYRLVFYAVLVSCVSFLLAGCFFAMITAESFYPFVRWGANWIVGLCACGTGYFGVWWMCRIPVRSTFHTWKTLRFEGICMLVISGLASIEESGNFDGLLKFLGIYSDAEGTVHVAFFFFLFFMVQTCLASLYRLSVHSDAWKYILSNLLFLLSVFFIGFGLGSIVASILLFALVLGGVSGALKGSSFTSASGEEKRSYEVVYDNELRRLEEDGAGLYKDQWGKYWKHGVDGFEPND